MFHATRNCCVALFLVGGALSATAAELTPAKDCGTVGRRYRGDGEAQCFALEHAGTRRTVRLYVPAHSGGGSRPLVVALHGGGGSGGDMEGLTERGFNRIADRDGIVIAYPDGIGKNWNDGRDLNAKAAKDDVDDVGFLRTLPQAIAAKTPIDLTRVYATGISNGGFMSYRLGCDAADVFAAVAPVTAALSVELAPRCKPSRPISIAIMNGTEDPFMPWAGGTVKVLWTKRGDAVSTPQTIDRWLALNGCSTMQVRERIDHVANDGTSLEHRSAACRDGTEVSVFEVRGGGHTWPDGDQYLGKRLVGRVSREFDANEAIWEFLRRFSLKR